MQSIASRESRRGKTTNSGCDHFCGFQPPKKFVVDRLPWGQRKPRTQGSIQGNAATKKLSQNRGSLVAQGSEAVDECERRVGDLLPAAVDRQRVTAIDRVCLVALPR